MDVNKSQLQVLGLSVENKMIVKIKKLHPDAVIPRYAKPGDAGMDLTATTVKEDDYGNITYGTGLAFEIPEGFVGLVYPRSSVYKTGLFMSNSVGVVDSGYRGEVFIKFTSNLTEELGFPCLYELGDRVGQLIVMPYPKINFIEVEELGETERGDGGFGSTGRTNLDDLAGPPEKGIDIRALEK